jgi:hypothetical protein
VLAVVATSAALAPTVSPPTHSASNSFFNMTNLIQSVPRAMPLAALHSRTTG